MSEPVEPPIVITDKREQKRQAAAQAAQLRAEAADQPSAASDVPVTDGARTLDRLERLQELRDAASLRDLVQEELDELLALQAEEADAQEQNQGEEGVPALTAFVVVIGHDGSARVEPDLNTLFALDRLATVNDMYSACHLVLLDINSAMAAKHTTFGLQVSAQAMKQQAAAASVMQDARMPGMPGMPSGHHR